MSKPMGDSFQAFALPEVGATNAAAVAAQLSDWLIAKGIGQRGALTAPPGVQGFSPGPQAENALASGETGWQSVAFREIHISSTRRVSVAVQGGLGPVFCPTCERPLGGREGLPPSFTRSVEEWHGGGEGMLACPACTATAPITKWRTEPFWAFGDVTITFWNWPRIKDGFAHDVEAVTGKSVKVVRGKI